MELVGLIRRRRMEAEEYDVRKGAGWLSPHDHAAGNAHRHQPRNDSRLGRSWRRSAVSSSKFSLGPISLTS